MVHFQNMKKIKETSEGVYRSVKKTGSNMWVSHRKKTIFGIIGLVILGLIIFGGSRKNVPENLLTVETATILDQVTLSGRTESVNSVDLGFADSGRVKRVYVTEGQKVKKGQVLAELEMGDLSAQYQSARAGLTIARANLQQGTVNLDKVIAEQDSIVETAKRNLYGNLEAYPEDIFSSLQAPKIHGSYQGLVPGEYRLDIYASNAATGASINYSGLDTGVISLTVDNRVALGNKGLYIQFPTNQGYANSKWVIPVPNTRSSQYSSLLSAYDTAIASRDRAIENAKSDLAGNNQSILQARVDQAQASLNQIASAMTRRKIVAPFSGTISQVALKEGESTIGISKDTSPGVSMLATDQYKVVIKIPEIDVARITPNTAVDITLDANSSETVFQGMLTNINPAETIVDGVPVYEGIVIFDEKNDQIRSGMTATVIIKNGEKQDVVSVPWDYLREDKVTRKYFITMIDPENQKKTIEKEVTIGLRGFDGMTEITNGLSVGETIVLPKKD